MKPLAETEYLSLAEDKAGSLVLSLKFEGREYLYAHLIDPADVSRGFTLRPARLFYDLLSDILEVGWDAWYDAGVYPPNMPWPTNAPIIARGVDRDDQGEVVEIERVWWFQKYAIEDELQTLLLTGSVTFEEAK